MTVEERIRRALYEMGFEAGQEDILDRLKSLRQIVKDEYAHVYDEIIEDIENYIR